MAGMDKFAEIAFQENPERKDLLREINEEPIRRKYFVPGSKAAGRIEEKSYEEKMAAFSKDLLKLRKEYEPYLKNFTPYAKVKRESRYINQFDFRYEKEEDRKNFHSILEGNGEWKRVAIPDYRGPVGKWTGYYRNEFTLDCKNDKRYFIVFKGVDYIANVYINGHFIGTHEGFFSPFEFDVTDYLNKNSENILIVEVKNDAPTVGIGSWSDKKVDGDKIYAATGPGWDDAELGWHHCPPGAGIYNSVYIEERAELFIKSVFVRPDIDRCSMEVWVEVYNTEEEYIEFDLNLSVYPRNFNGEEMEGIECEIEPAGTGVNYYRLRINMDDFRLWEPSSPYLYTLRATLILNDVITDEYDCSFGMRKFHMDEAPGLKGTIYLNNNPIILRGANEMGHLQQCVIKNDYEQLIEDILIAKLANMNYFRITQRPVQEEIYNYCDMLGIMNQTDLPLFGYIRRNQFSEGIRQSGEMEKLIRSHPSSIMVTFINEAFSAVKQKVGHRHLYRNEMEDFFEGASKSVRLENPDRVIKNVEGDYNPPTRTGLSDFHCYNMWYTNHTLPIGKMHKGYIPPIKEGWKTGCGEYSGGEGLDPLEVMKYDYPSGWLPEELDDKWTPEKIVKSQTFSMHGDWYEEQETIVDWIRESQRHQALGTRMMTDSLRRRSDYVISTAIHLLIDAWPSGWMKSIVDHKRKPKPAYFELQESLIPLRVNLRTDRFKFYCGEKAEIEAWILNDTNNDINGLKIRATVRDEYRDYEAFELAADVKSVNAGYKGTIMFNVPDTSDRGMFFVDAELVDSIGNIVNSERLKLEAFEKDVRQKSIKVTYIGSAIKGLLDELKVDAFMFKPDMERPEYLVAGTMEFENNRDLIEEWIESGTKAVFLLGQECPDKFNMGNFSIEIKKMVTGINFAARNSEESVTKDFKPLDFSFWYNGLLDRIDYISEKYMEGEDITPLIFSYSKPGFFDCAIGRKKKLSIAGYKCCKKGKVYLSLLPWKGYSAFNPVLGRFITNIICN